MDIFVTVFTDQHFLSAFCQTMVVILLGFFFMRKGFVNEAGKKTISALIWKLAVPCFAFNAFMQDFEWNRFKTSIVEFVLAIFFHIILIFFGKVLLSKKGKDISTIGGFFTAIGQTTLFSMPILQSVYEGHEEQVMLYISSISIVFRIFVYIIGLSVISGEKISFKNFGSSMKKVFLNPVMIGMFAGIIIFVIQNITPQVTVGENHYSFLRVDKTLPVIYSTVRNLSRLVSPLCMFLIGMNIGEAKLSDCIKDRLAWCLALLRNIAGPVIVCAFCFAMHKLNIVHFTEDSLMAIVIGFSAPISVSLSIACVQYHREETLASRACVISTLLTLVTFPMAFVMCRFVLKFMC